MENNFVSSLGLVFLSEFNSLFDENQNSIKQKLRVLEMVSQSVISQVIYFLQLLRYFKKLKIYFEFFIFDSGLV